MRQDIPEKLFSTLSEFGLARRQVLRAARSRVSRLTRDLPAFDQVWIDALVQARRLTPFQAQLLTEDRASQLRVGPYLLVSCLGRSDLGETYHARPLPRGRPVALRVIDPHLASPETIQRRLEPVLERFGRLKSRRHLAVPHRCGIDDGRFWIAGSLVAGPQCADLLVHRGRMAPALVHELARQLLSGLIALWSGDMVHGDLRPSHVRITSQGKAVMTDATIRISLPEAALLCARSLPPDRFDYLAPEAFTIGCPLTPAADQFALGCLLWHLLAGRPPFPGAEADAKRVARQRGELTDVRELAPETPPELAAAIATLTRRDPEQRAQEPEALLRELGSSRVASRRRLAKLGMPLRRRFSRRVPFRLRWQWAVAAVLAVTGLVAASMIEGSLLSRQVTGLRTRLSHFVARLGVWHTPSPRDETALPAGNVDPKAPDDARVAHHRSTAPGDRSSSIQTVSAEAGWHPNQRVIRLTDPVYRLSGDQLTSRLRQAKSATLEPGHRIVGSPSNPPLILVEHAPLEIVIPNVRWEDVRFVLAETARLGDKPLVILREPGASFRNCSFEVPHSQSEASALVAVSARSASWDACSFHGPPRPGLADPATLPAAIQWQIDAEPASRANTSVGAMPPELTCRATEFENVAAGVTLVASGQMHLALDDCLYNGPGTFVNLGVPDAALGHVEIKMSQCTAQGADAVLTVAYNGSPTDWLGCAIQPEDCEFLFDRPSARDGSYGALVMLRGTRPPQVILDRVRWTGMGCVVASTVPIPPAVWSRGGRREVLPNFYVDGVVAGTTVPRRSNSTAPSSSE